MCNEHGTLCKLLFGTDFPVTPTYGTMRGLCKIADYAERMPFPSATREGIGALIERDVLPELGLESAGDKRHGWQPEVGVVRSRGLRTLAQRSILGSAGPVPLRRQVP